METRGFEEIKNGVTILNTFIEEEDYKEAFEDYADYSRLKIEKRHGDVCAIGADGEEVKTLYEYTAEAKEFESNEFWEDLERAKKSSYIDYYVVTGELGLWNGNHTIVPETFDNLYDALSKCATDAYDIVVKYENNAIKFECHHHDGTNYFEVRNLSFDDYDKIEWWDDDKDGDIFEFIEKHARPISWQMIGNE